VEHSVVPRLQCPITQKCLSSHIDVAFGRILSTGSGNKAAVCHTTISHTHESSCYSSHYLLLFDYENYLTKWNENEYKERFYTFLHTSSVWCKSASLV